MPVEFLSDEEETGFGRYRGPPAQDDLDRLFFLDDAGWEQQYHQPKANPAA